MSIKTVEMVRNIRNKHYEETKDLSVQTQIHYIRKKSEELLRDFHR